MLNIKNITNLSFYSAVKYQNSQSYTSNYSNLPRPCHNIAFMLEGEGTNTTEKDTLHIKKGDIFYIPKNSTYISKWENSPNVIYHSLHFNFQPSNDPFIDKIIPIQLLPNAEFATLYQQLLLIQKHQYTKSLDYFLALSAIYYLCGQLLPFAKIDNTIVSKNNIIPALLYLENNSTAPCSIEQLANLCFLSPSRFFYLFKKEVGCTPITYKNQILIQKVSQDLLLHKDTSIENIAQEYGFNSPVYFRRLFKKLVGKSPSQFRKDEMLI